MRILRKIWNVSKWVMVSLLGIFIILLLVLQLSVVQTYVTKHASNYLSKELKTKIQIGYVNITPLLNVELGNVLVEDLKHKKLIQSEKIIVNIGSINFNSKSLSVSRVIFNKLDFALCVYKGESELNLQFIIDYFSDTTSSASKPWKIRVRELQLRNSNFRYDLEKYEPYPLGMDYNHLSVQNINLKLTDFETVEDTLVAKIAELSGVERSGFKLTNLTSDVKISSTGLFLPNLYIETPGSKISADLHFEYKEWNDWNDFVQKMKMIVDFKPSTIFLSELSPYTTFFKGMEDTIRLQGTFKGTVASFKVRDLKLEYAKNTVFEGSLKMDGLPYIDKTFIMVKADKIISNKQEIESIYLTDYKQIKLPSTFDDLGDIKANGRFTGYYYDFVSDATFVTGFGQISSDISLQPQSGSRKLAYNGNLKAENFQLGKLIKMEELMGAITFSADIKGIGLDDSTNAVFNIAIESFEFDNYLYKDVSSKGKIANKTIVAQLHSELDEFKLDASGKYNYGKKLPIYNLEANVKNARVARFTRSQYDTLGDFSGIVKVELEGNNIDNLDGVVNIDSLIYNYKGKTYHGGNIDLSTRNISGNRKIEFNSKYFNLDLSGDYSFSDFEENFKTMIGSILPSLLPELQLTKISDKKLKSVGKSHFDLNVNFFNTEDISTILFPQIRIASGSRLIAHYSEYNDSLNFSWKSSKMKTYGISFQNINLTGRKSDKILTSRLIASKMNLTDSLSFDSLFVNCSVSGDSAYYKSRWGKAGTRINRGLLEGNFIFYEKNEILSKIKTAEVIFNDSLWVLSEDNEIIYKDHFLKVKNFKISSANNSISANGLLTDNPIDKLVVDFKSFNLGFFNPFLENYIPKIGGIINGQIDLSNIWKSTGFFSNLTLNNFVYNDQYIGNADIQSRWSISNQALAVDISVDDQNENISNKSLYISGFYFPYNNQNKFDLSINLNEFQVRPFDYILSSFSSITEGKLSGAVKLNGTPDNIIIRGDVLADIKKMKIDYTNTYYHFKDYIHFDEGLISAKKIVCYDSYYSSGSSNQAMVNFKLTHKRFDDFYLDVDVTPNEALVLNTSFVENPYYYGRAVGTGKMRIYGPFDNLKMQIDAVSNKGTSMAFNIDDESGVEQYDFVTFTKRKVESDSVVTILTKPEEPFYFNLGMNVRVNQDATVQLIMDRETNDVITTKGTGDFRMNINEEGDMSIFGKYTITKGDYNFVFNNVKIRQFQIKEGSSITWDGSIYDAKMDIVAQYKTNARLSDLLVGITGIDSTNESYKRPTKVICLINIKGDLYNPEITFGINLPDETIENQELVNKILTLNDDKVNNNLLNLNFLSLLITGRFQPPNGFDINTQALSTNNATEMLANQLSSILNKLSKDVNIDLNWNSGDDQIKQEIAVALSYSLFNDRLIIDGKFGSGGEQKNSQTSRIVGDVDVEYKITKDGLIRIKAYNHTNYEDPITKKAPYTQGAGIAFRKDFDSFSELFRRKKKSEPVKE